MMENSAEAKKNIKRLQELRYIERMRLNAVTILVLVFVSFLSIQISGLHQHLNINGSDGGIHGTHLHNVNPDSHDHSAHVDVSFFELGVAWSKAMPFLIMFALTLLTTGKVARSVIFPHSRFLSPRRRSHWRPPLRAPPLSA
jgi:hypothetical protein